jgi:hypothetical protein
LMIQLSITHLHMKTSGKPHVFMVKNMCFRKTMKKNIRSTLNFTFVAPSRNHGNTRSKLYVTSLIEYKFHNPSNSRTRVGSKGGGGGIRHPILRKI